jgi:hypothetical protein
MRLDRITIWGTNHFITSLTRTTQQWILRTWTEGGCHAM